MKDTNKFEIQRRGKLERIKQLDVDPYGGRYEGAERACDIRDRFKEADDTQQANCAGRIVLLRDIGKLIFITARLLKLLPAEIPQGGKEQPLFYTKNSD